MRLAASLRKRLEFTGLSARRRVEKSVGVRARDGLIPKSSQVRARPVSKQDVELGANESSWTEAGDNWLLNADGWRVLIDPQRGARITGFFVGETNLLTGPEVDAENHGSTFWTSPQSDWQWPPPPEVDHMPYAVLEGDEDVLVCCGMPCSKLGVLITKRFSLSKSNGALRAEYEICNQTNDILKMAPWEISRVRGGLTVFAAGQPFEEPTPLPKPLVVFEEQAQWFEYDRAAVQQDQKWFAHSDEGWLAHISDGCALIKEFEVVPVQKQAPAESMIEVFASGSRDYIEIEQQGPYVKIGPWKSFAWTVTWKGVRVPGSLKVAAGDRQLLDWIRSQLG